MPCRDDGDFRILFYALEAAFFALHSAVFPCSYRLENAQKAGILLSALKEPAFCSRSLKSPVFYPWKVNGGAADFNEERRPFPILRLRRFAGLFYKSRVYFSQSLES